jgi:hypothetical protein
MKTKQIKTQCKFIEFPNPEYEYFAESFVIQDETIYFPLNSLVSNGAFYAYTRNKFNKLFDFKKGEIILGSKIYNDNLVCVCAHQILICDLLTGENKYYIDLGRIIPNDLCIIDNDIYCGGNVTTNPDCGVVLRICKPFLKENSRRCKQRIVVEKLDFVCGINTLNNKLYVSSLNAIAAFDLQTFAKLETFTNNIDCPLYDNITVYKKELYVAIHQKSPLIYSLLDNPISNPIIYWSLVYSGLFTIADGLNYWRRLNGNKISYIRIKNGKATKYILDEAFDDTTTQIARLDKKTMILVNWKATGFIFLSV